MASNLDLFEPERLSKLDQYFTPAWIARRAARWIPEGAIVLEPSAGSGRLVRAASERGHAVVAVELDERWRTHIAEAGADETIFGNFLELPIAALLERHRGHPMCALENPPYGNKEIGEGLDVRFVERTLEQCGHAIALLKTDIEYSDGRNELWMAKAQIVRRAQLVDRPKFGRNVYDETDGELVDKVAGGGAERNYEVLELRARTSRRPTSETVLEERWRQTDPESTWTGPMGAP